MCVRNRALLPLAGSLFILITSKTNNMLILAKLVFKSYMPKQLEMGMWFKKDHSDVLLGKIYNYLTIYELKEIPNDMYEYMSVYGAPVEPFIIQPMNNPDDVEEILVRPEFIGWWESDEGYEDDDGNWTESIQLEDLSPKTINEWIYGENGDNDGLIALEVDDETREPKLYEDTNKVIIKQSDYVDEDDDEDTIEEEYLEEEEDWDDMDDEPEFELGGSE
jgi:hypothetical protein